MTQSAECWVYGICPHPEVPEESLPAVEPVSSYLSFTTRHLMLIVGLFLMVFSKVIPVKVKYYLSACMLGIGGLLVFVLYSTNLFFHRKLIALSSGLLATSTWWIILSFFHSYFYKQILILLFLTIISSILVASFLDLSVKTDDIIAAVWQITGSALVLFYSHDIIYFCLVLVILIVNNIAFTRPFFYWRSPSNYTKRFLTLKEYEDEGLSFTRAELERLRLYIVSADCDVVDLVLRLKNPKEFFRAVDYNDMALSSMLNVEEIDSVSSSSSSNSSYCSLKD